MKKLKHIAMGLFLMLMLLSAASVQAALPTPTLAKLVSAQATGCASARITWEKAENAFYYRVYGMVDGKYVGLGVTQGTSMEVKSSETMPLIPGKTYQFTVRSYNRNADKTEVVMGPYDRNGLKVTLPKPDLPAVGNLTATSLDYNKNKISWDPVPGAQGYRVYYRKDGKLVGLVKGPATSYTHVSSDKFPLITGEKTNYAVRAYVEYSGVTFLGAYKTTGVNVKNRPQTPVITKIAREGGNKVTLKWNACVGASKYKIYWKKSGNTWSLIDTIDATSTEYTHTSSSTYPLSNGNTYLYAIRSYSTYGDINSNLSKESSIKFSSAEYDLDQKIHAQAKVVIARLTSPSQSTSSKLNTCFNWCLSCKYKPNSNPNYSRSLWQKEWAYDFLVTHAGSCHGCAYGFAALARELGYHPYVITIPRVHSIVQINGGYWDNMGPKRGTYTRPSGFNSGYQVYDFK